MKIKEKYSYYNKLQDEDNKEKILRVLNKWYSILESRIQSSEFHSIEEIGNDFIQLEDKFTRDNALLKQQIEYLNKKMETKKKKMN